MCYYPILTDVCQCVHHHQVGPLTLLRYSRAIKLYYSSSNHFIILCQIILCMCPILRLRTKNNVFQFDISLSDCMVAISITLLTFLFIHSFQVKWHDNIWYHGQSGSWVFLEHFVMKKCIDSMILYWWGMDLRLVLFQATPQFISPSFAS